MNAGIDYDTTNFKALQDELKALNRAALADGFVAPHDGRIVMPHEVAAPRPTPAKAPAKPDLGKAAVTRLLAIIDGDADDSSAAVPGTRFTEAGVGRLMAHLRRRRSRRIGPWLRFLERAERYLSRPVPAGLRTIEGVGLERLQVFSRQLDEIATDGWARFSSARATRRSRIARADTFTFRNDEAAPAAARRKGSSR